MGWRERKLPSPQHYDRIGCGTFGIRVRRLEAGASETITLLAAGLQTVLISGHRKEIHSHRESPRGSLHRALGRPLL